MRSLYNQLLIVLIALSVITASVFAAHIPPLWWPFTASVIVLSAALAGLRLLNRESGQTIAKQETPVNRFIDLIQTLIHDLETTFLNEAFSQKWLDRLEEKLEHFQLASESLRPGLVDSLGMKQFIAVITPFAQAERQLNRALSAAMDEYPDESLQSLQDARIQLIQTVELLQSENA